MTEVLKNLLVFQTDFGYKDSTVAAMYGVVKSVGRNIEIIDSTHELPQYDVWSASYRLWQCMRFWPKGTVFVSVVDPGVGTDRKACVALTEDGYYVVTPDNGSLTHVKKYHGIKQVREIDETVNRLHHAGTDKTSVFHGRDLFGYCAAKLTAGIISFEQVGPVYNADAIVTLDMPEPVYGKDSVNGYIEIDDPNFGNLFTNIETEKLPGSDFSYHESVRLTIRYRDEIVFNKVVPFEKTFGNIGKGEAVIYNNELMHVSLAVRQGSFVDTYGVHFGPEWTVRLEKVKK